MEKQKKAEFESVKSPSGSGRKSRIKIDEVVRFFDIEEYIYSENGKKIREYIHRPLFNIGETSKSYRIINYWDSEGLLPSSRSENDKGWRKFSLIDLFWLEIINELRDFGFPISKIKKVKEAVFCDFTSRGVTPLEYYFSLSFGNKKKKDSYLLVFSDGDANFATKSQISDTESDIGLDNHISINFNIIGNRVLKKPKFKKTNEKSHVLSEKENKLISIIQDGDFDTLIIKNKDGEIHRIEKTSDYPIEDQKHTADQVKKILGSADFQEIVLKKDGGKVVSIKSSVKELI